MMSLEAWWCIQEQRQHCLGIAEVPLKHPTKFLSKIFRSSAKNSWIIHMKSNLVSIDENFCRNTSNRVLSRHGYDEGGTKIHVFHASRDDLSKILAEKFKMCVKYYRERERERKLHFLIRNYSNGFRFDLGCSLEFNYM